MKKNMDELSVQEVGVLLSSIGFGFLVAPCEAEEIDGLILMNFGEEDVKKLYPNIMPAKIKVLLIRIQKFVAEGVPTDTVSSSALESPSSQMTTANSQPSFSPDVTFSGASIGNVDVFFSLRFTNPWLIDHAKKLKEALERDYHYTTVLVEPLPGADLFNAVISNIKAAKVVVILGTQDYAEPTSSPVSTCQELNYVMSAKKPFF
jgi:hypothetical protein